MCLRKSLLVELVIVSVPNFNRNCIQFMEDNQIKKKLRVEIY